MNTSKNRQLGFGTSAIVAIVAVVIVIAGIGFFITKRNTRTAPTSAATSPSPTTAPATPTPTPASGGSLIVKEWGVTVPLPDSVKDVYYVVSISSADQDGTPNTVLLGRPEFDTLGCKAADGNSGKKPIAMITRSRPGDTDPVKGTPYAELYPNGVTISGFYYAYVSWATTNTCVPKASFQTLDTGMAEAIKQTKITAN